MGRYLFDIILPVPTGNFIMRIIVNIRLFDSEIRFSKVYRQEVEH